MRNFLLVSSFLLFTTIILLSSTTTSFVTSLKTEGEEPDYDEDKYRPVINCIVCEQLVKRYIRKMTKTPLGTSVKSGRLSKKETGKTETAEQKRLKKSTATAWATELLEDVCTRNIKSNAEDIKSFKDQQLCENALESTDDMLVNFATKRQVEGTVAELGQDMKAVNSTAEDLCMKSNHCSFRNSMKKQMDKMKESISNSKRNNSNKTPLWKLVVRELKINWKMYLSVFGGCVFLFTAMFVMFRVPTPRRVGSGGSGGRRRPNPRGADFEEEEEFDEEERAENAKVENKKNR